MRPLPLILLLTATHGAAVWWGFSAGAGPAAVAERSGPAVARKEEPVLDMAKLLAPEPEKPQPAPGPSWKEQVEAARKAIPADADVVAIVKAELPDPRTAEDMARQGQEFARKTAAFGLWMEKDPVAALRWMTGNANWSVDEGVRKYLEGKELTEVNRLVREVPEAAGTVVKAATALALEKGQAEVIQLAAAIGDSGNAFKVLNGAVGFTPELPAQLPAIRKLLDERGAQEFLLRFGRMGDITGLAEAAAAAGFSEEAVQRMEGEYAKVVDYREKKKADEALTMADRIRAGNAGPPPMTFDREDPRLMKEAPEFESWCKDFADERLDGTEVMAKFREALGNPDGIDRPMHEYLFKKIYPMNPAAAIDWLKQEEADWQGMVKDAAPGVSQSDMDMQKIKPEAYWNATESLSPEEQEATGMSRRLMEIYKVWHKEDPEDCLRSVERLPAGPLKDRLLASLKGGGR
ncbi:hypothetical protein [Haloferula sp. BvORR071]|uniref:hypothetical protein n=1 Tax=Haloferula sp. BvORR071 TaxID=1396141 RepID=UPI00054E303D|nr:hypothetical protein [Haloferula sp. BvORR071]